MARKPIYVFMDSAGVILAQNPSTSFTDFLLCAVINPGTYYCSIIPGTMPHEAAWYFRYGITCRVEADLEIMTIGPGSYVSSNGKYLLEVTGKQNNVSLSIVANQQAEGTVTFASIPADSSVITLPSDERPLTLMSISATDAISTSMDSATIRLGYTDTALKGESKNDIVARYYSDSAGSWLDIPFKPDTQTNTMNIPTTHFSIYGLFLRTPVGTRAPFKQANNCLAEQIKIDCLSQAVQFRFSGFRPGIIRARLYSVNGRLIASASGTIGPFDGSGLIALPLDNKARSGIYVLSLDAPGVSKTKMFHLLH
jgi:hypothetical protein